MTASLWAGCALARRWGREEKGPVQQQKERAHVLDHTVATGYPGACPETQSLCLLVKKAGVSRKKTRPQSGAEGPVAAAQHTRQETRPCSPWPGCWPSSLPTWVSGWKWSSFPAAAGDLLAVRLFSVHVLPGEAEAFAKEFLALTPRIAAVRLSSLRPSPFWVL